LRNRIHDQSRLIHRRDFHIVPFLFETTTVRDQKSDFGLQPGAKSESMAGPIFLCPYQFLAAPGGDPLDTKQARYQRSALPTRSGRKGGSMSQAMPARRRNGQSPGPTILFADRNQRDRFYSWSEDAFVSSHPPDTFDNSRVYD